MTQYILSKVLVGHRKSQMRKLSLVSVDGKNSSIHFSAFDSVCVHYQHLYLATCGQGDSAGPGLGGVEYIWQELPWSFPLRQKQKKKREKLQNSSKSLMVWERSTKIVFHFILSSGLETYLFKVLILYSLWKATQTTSCQENLLVCCFYFEEWQAFP